MDSSDAGTAPFEVGRRWTAGVRGSEAIRYFVGQGMLLWPLNLLGAVLGLVSTILYARFFSPDQYGRFSYVIATVSMLSFLALPGVYTAIAQSAAQGADGFFRRGTRARQRFSLLGCAVLVLIGIACWERKGFEVALAFFAAALLFPFHWPLDGVWAVLTGKKRFRELAVCRLIQMLATAAATWIALLTTRSVPLVFAANIGMMALTNFIFYHWVVRRYESNDRVQSESMGYGKRLSALSVLITVEGRVDNVLLGTFLPFQTLGWFNIASRINEAAMQEPWTATAQMLFPRLAEVPQEEARRRARIWGAGAVGAFALLALLFWLFAPWVLPWIVGPHYAQSIRLAKWLVLIQAINVPWSIFEVYCQARAAERSLWLTRLAVTGTHLAALALLLPRWGVDGVLWSIAASRVVGVLTSVLLYRRANR